MLALGRLLDSRSLDELRADVQMIACIPRLC